MKMLKNCLTLCLCLCSLGVFAEGFTWSVESAVPGELSVRVKLPEYGYLEDERTTVQLQGAGEMLSAPPASTYSNPSTCGVPVKVYRGAEAVWRFKVDASNPPKVYVNYRGGVEGPSPAFLPPGEEILSLTETASESSAETADAVLPEARVFSWSVERPSAETVTVRAKMREHTYLYVSETRVKLLGAGTVVSEPESDSHADAYAPGGAVNVYPAPEAQWTFKIDPASPPTGVSVAFQGCSEGENATCYPPEELTLSLDGNQTPVSVKTAADSGAFAFLDGFEMVHSASGYLNADEFQTFLKGDYSNNPLADKSFLMVVILVLLGGLALNLTPCVLPMLPITLSIIGAGSAAESKGAGFARGGVYALGMTVAYGALGLAAVLTGAQFGTINASPWFNVCIAVLFIGLGLAMFDIFQIDFSRYGAKFDARNLNKGRLLGVFALGAVTAILGGACVAPAVIATLLYTAQNYAAGNVWALMLPVLLGVGMALPWPFAGAGLSVLPKPGMWMVKVKMVLGVLIIGLGGYYGWTAYTLFEPESSAEGAVHSPVSELEAGIERAKLSGKPVLIDFWATWCKNCLQMNATTFKDPAVIESLKGFEVVKFQAEQMSEPSVKAVLDRYRVSGLPTCVILEPKK